MRRAALTPPRHLSFSWWMRDGGLDSCHPGRGVSAPDTSSFKGYMHHMASTDCTYITAAYTDTHVEHHRPPKRKLLRSWRVIAGVVIRTTALGTLGYDSPSAPPTPTTQLSDSLTDQHTAYVDETGWRNVHLCPGNRRRVTPWNAALRNASLNGVGKDFVFPGLGQRPMRRTPVTPRTPRALRCTEKWCSFRCEDVLGG